MAPVPEMAQVTKEKKKQPSNEDSDEEGYDEPYDLGKVTVLDEQLKRLSMRGMRPLSVDSAFPPGHDDKRGRMNSDAK